MSSQIFPALQGISGLEVTRNYAWKTAVQEAVSGKMTALPLRTYPLVRYELVVNLMRNNQTPSELLQLQGLYNSLQGRGDTFLYNDPDFNTVSLMSFATTDGASTSYQITAAYQNIGGPGGAELIQNFNGVPAVFVDRYTGTLQELLTTFSRTNFLLQSQALATTWTANAVTPTNNISVAPDGTTTGTRILETATTAQHGVSQIVTTIPSAAEDIAFSVWVENNLTRNFCALQMTENTGGTVVNQTFNLSTGVVGATSNLGANWSNPRVSIQQSGAYYRISITVKKNNAATSVTFALLVSNADSLATYLGVTADGITAWGAQAEVETTGTGGPTFYLPTTTTVATQTDYSLGPTGIVALNFTPAANWSLSWSGSFYYRCRFEEDEISWQKFMAVGLWTVKKLAFTSVKL